MMRALAFLVLFVAASAAAQVRPSPSDGDRRIQSVRYDPDQVVTLEVTSGTQLSVALLSGERIETIAVGDSNGWQLSTSKRGDYLFIKNLGTGSTTNATVVTDTRTYSFELLASYGNEIAYLVRFQGDAPLQAIAVRSAPTPNYQYRISGAMALRPSRLMVDGVRTIIEWAPDRALPAIFRIDEDGRETLVNSVVEDGIIVIDGAPEKLVFRLDHRIATATRVLARRKRA
jgi:type IV secretion system protein VirB9